MSRFPLFSAQYALLKPHLFFWSKVLFIYTPFILLLLFLIPRSGHGWDNTCWTEWAKYIYANKLSHIYRTWTDYLPLYHYILCLYGKIQGSTEAIASNIYMLKAFTIVFEFASTLILFQLIHEKTKDTYKSIGLSLLYFFNIAVLYNSMVWGQIDGIMTFFIFASVFFGYRKQLFLCLLFFILGINLKLQAIIFLPLVFILITPLVIKQNVKTVGSILLMLLAVQFLILWPFIKVGDLPKVGLVVTNSVGKFPVLSMNAFNMWYLFFDKDLLQIPYAEDSLTMLKDSMVYKGLTYKQWGLLLFFISGFGALYPFIKR